MQKILITSALPYANGPLHFGHIAGAYLPADAYARFERLRGNKVLYICGSDEYGVAITLSAEIAKRTPKEQVDQFHKINRDFFDILNIKFDHFSRTTADIHRETVQEFFKDLYENGYIEERETLQLYSESENRFLADRYVVGTCPRCKSENARGDECLSCGASYEATDLISPRSKLTNSPLSSRKTKHWFLLFDKFKEKISSFIESHPWKSNVVNFARSYASDVRPRAITRDLEWGVPVPLKGAEGKVFYVWFDAPIGYISATKEWAIENGDKDLWKDFWCDQTTRYVQFIGKDNIPFHAIFFPAMIMGQNQNYKIVDDLVSNEFYNLEGKRFSKSEGWYIDLDAFFKKFRSDQIRYTLAANAPEMGDSEFTWRDFQFRCNGELLGKFGNLVNRVLVFIQNNCNAKVPVRHELEEADQRFLNAMSRLCLEIEKSYSAYRLRRASQLIMELAQMGNSYFDVKTPWKDLKDNYRAMETTISLCLECLKLLACVSFPIIPETAEKIWKMLGFSSLIESHSWDDIMQKIFVEDCLELPKPSILFEKIEDSIIEEEIEKLEKRTKKSDQFFKEKISFSDFAKIDLRVGKIVQAEKLEKSKKLLKLQIDLGNETRTILSGISQHYTAEELIDQKVVVVANLKPIKIMGVESHGMVLAGSIDTAVELIKVKDLPAGAEVS